MTTVFAQQSAPPQAATPVERVLVSGWTGVQVNCLPVPQAGSVCLTNPAPNASQPFVPSLATHTEVRSTC